MDVKAGKVTLPASGSVSVTGLPFAPKLIYFIMTDAPTEDSWTTGGLINGGVGIASKNTGGGVDCSCIGEVWASDAKPASWYSNSVIFWARANRTSGAGGYAFFCSAMGSDGFTLQLIDGYTSGASGKFVYYLAFGDIDNAARTFHHKDNQGYQTIGFKPTVLFASAHGGFDPPSGNAVALADFATPSYAVGGWDENKNPIRLEMMVMDEGLHDDRPVPNESRYFSTERNQVIQVFDPQLGATFVGSGYFSPTRTDTQIHHTWNDEFLGDNIRMSAHTADGIAPYQLFYTPISTLNTDQFVATPTIDPMAGIFFGPHEAVNDGPAVRGGRSIGIVTEDFQAVIAFGGHYATTTARYMSSNKAWVSNFVSGTMGSSPSHGTIELDRQAGGFISRTTANDKSMEELYFTLFGPDEALHLLPILHVGD